MISAEKVPEAVGNHDIVYRAKNNSGWLGFFKAASLYLQQHKSLLQSKSQAVCTSGSQTMLKKVLDVSNIA